MCVYGGGHDLYISDNCNIQSDCYSSLGHTYKCPGGYEFESQ